MILLLIQKLQCGNPMEKENEKKVIAARGMVLSVTGRLVMSSAFTLLGVVSMVLSTPTASYSVLFISRGLTSLITISIAL